MRTRRPDSLRKSLLVVLVFMVLGVGFLSPMASSSLLPDQCDLVNHLVYIMEARAGLEQGELPLRTMPGQHHGLGYPGFQFYSQLPYVLAGSLHATVARNNPFLAYKITLWIGYVAAGYFTYLLARRMFGSGQAALLAGVTYVTAPYFAINVHARGAFAEALAQCLIPAVVYYSYDRFLTRRSSCLIRTALVWFALAVTHLITFLFTTGFLFCILGLYSRRPARWAQFGVSYALGCAMAMFFLGPVVTTDFLVVRSQLMNPYGANNLTPLAALLSPTSLPPFPQPGSFPLFNIHPALGIVGVAGVGVVFGSLIWPAGFAPLRRYRRLSRSLLAGYLLAVFLTWSPLDFWQYLPKQFQVVQFPYRILSQTAWTGALLAGVACLVLFGRKLDTRHSVVGILLILVATSSYLVTCRPHPMGLRQLMAAPKLEYGVDAYLPDPRRIALAEEEKTLSLQVIRDQFESDRFGIRGNIEVDARSLVPLPILAYGDLLEVTVDGKPAPVQAVTTKDLPMQEDSTVDRNYVRHSFVPPVDYAVAAVLLEPGRHHIEARFRGLAWANLVSVGAFAIVTGILLMRAIRWK